MAQYKFPTTVGEVEFKELGSDEVSFYLQFYNNKDANLEHIETTPHKVNGLELQNLEKSEVDQLFDEIKRLVSPFIITLILVSLGGLLFWNSPFSIVVLDV